MIGPEPSKRTIGPVALWCASKQVEAANDAFVDAFWLRRHWVILVVDGDVVDDVHVLGVHLIDAVADDGGQFVSERRIPCSHGRVGVGHQQGVAVLVLQDLLR